MSRQELARRLAEIMEKDGGMDRWSVAVATANGGTVRGRMRPDYDYDLFREEDWFGQVGPFCDYRRDTRAPRPDGFTGAARKLHSRHGFLWWQPPADVTEPARVEVIYQRVAAYARDGWTYTVLAVEYVGPACSHGHYPAPEVMHLGGVESDASVDNLAEMLADMLSEVGITE